MNIAQRLLTAIREATAPSTLTAHTRRLIVEIAEQAALDNNLSPTERKVLIAAGQTAVASLGHPLGEVETLIRGTALRSGRRLQSVPSAGQGGA